ncbi:MAG: DUF1902 domain-containing protein [Oscillospiraceae bacterium]|jgi:hypothetical protein|nr:DUF1902 domain-containing protein [Oscillospiraceae bacterium]
MEYVVNILWDEDSKMWYSESDDIAVSTESGSLDALIERIRCISYDLLHIDLQSDKQKKIFIKINAERKVKL